MNNSCKLFRIEKQMSGEKIDRRVQRTRELLKRALTGLIHEKGYDAVTIQDITERANLGRTTFYLHYQSKDDLLLDHYGDFAAHLNLQLLSYEDLIQDEPPPAFEQFLTALAESKAFYLAVTRAKDHELIMRGMHQKMAENLLDSLNSAFPTLTPRIPPDILTNYIAGAQISLIDWWVMNRSPYTASDVARMLHQLQRAVVKDAYGENMS